MNYKDASRKIKGKRAAEWIIANKADKEEAAKYFGVSEWSITQWLNRVSGELAQKVAEVLEFRREYKELPYRGRIPWKQRTALFEKWRAGRGQRAS